jgi:hypothetical protein
MESIAKPADGKPVPLLKKLKLSLAG